MLSRHRRLTVFPAKRMHTTRVAPLMRSVEAVE